MMEAAAQGEGRVIAYTNVGHALVHASEVTYGALLLRMQADLGATEAFMGAVASVFGWAFGATALPAGFLADRWGPAKVLAFTFASACGACLLVAMAASPWMLALGMALLGLATGFYHPAGTTLIAQGVRSRGLAMGYHGVAGNVGMGLAPAIAGGIATLWTWRGAYVALAASAAALALWASRLRVRPLAMWQEGRHQAGFGAPVGRLMVALLAVYVGSILMGMVYRGSMTFLPAHLHEKASARFADSLTTLVLLIGALGQYAGGALTRRVRLEWLALWVVAWALPPLVLVGLLGGGPMVAVAGAFIFLHFAHQPIFNTLIADYSPPALVGRSFGLVYLAAFGLGGAGGIIAGAMVDRWDTGAAFIGMAGVWALALLATVPLPFLVKRQTLAPKLAHIEPDNA
jgi:MFS family permease